VPPTARAPCRPAAARPGLEVAEIFRAHGEAYRQRHTVDTDQRAAMRAIAACRTAALGGHVDVCDTCGHERPAYNSCLMGSDSLWGVTPWTCECYADVPQVALPIKIRP